MEESVNSPNPKRRRLLSPVRASNQEIELPDYFEMQEALPAKFKLDLRSSKSFKGAEYAEEKTFSFQPIEPENAQQQSSASSDEEPLMIDHLSQLHGMFDTLIDSAHKQYNKKDLARMFIKHPDLNGEIIVGPMRLNNMTTSEVMEKVSLTLHSASHVPFNRRLRMDLAVVKNISGSGKRDGSYWLDYERDRKLKRCIVCVPSPSPDDKNCLARAILIGKKYLDAEKEAENVEDKKKRDAIFSKARYFCAQRAGKKLQKEVEELKQAVGLPLNEAGEIQDIGRYEVHLNVSICVLSGMLKDKIIYSGNEQYRDKSRRIYLYHWKPTGASEWHFDLIRSMSAFMVSAYYCYDCDVPYQHKDQHSCKKICSVCENSKCELIGVNDSIQCPDCNRTCRSKKCFDHHKKETPEMKSLCFRKYKCLQCNTVLLERKRSRKHHICTETFCQNCQQWFANLDEGKTHFCHMRALEAEEPVERFIFYDFESTQESGQHIPNLVIAQSCCKFCSDSGESNDIQSEFCIYCGTRCSSCDNWCRKTKQYTNYPCQDPEKNCGKREVVFRGEDVTHEFGSWLISRQHRNCVVVAHNAKGYDNYFILNYLLQVNIAPNVIFQGSKVSYMQVGRGINIKCLDSIMFLPMALAQLPKCFDLKELKKGYFPHFFNKPSNYGSILPCLPPKEDYGYDTMTSAKQATFDQWYSQNKDALFNFEKEMEDYCRSDVDILRRACMTYRDLLMLVTEGVDPFTFVSAASVCMGVFRSRFLKERWQVLRKNGVRDTNCAHDFDTCTCLWREAEKLHGDAPVRELKEVSADEERQNPIIRKRFVSSDIGLLPPTEYRSSDNYSMEALKWLQFEQQRINENLKFLGEAEIEMQTALSSEGEKKVPLPRWNEENGATTVKLDGFYTDPVTGCDVALEFYGCHWHGCPKCFPCVRKRVETKCQNSSLEQRYQNTLLREERLRASGFVLKTIWACDFAKEIAEGKVPENISNIQYSSPLHLRDAYFGGRTAPIKLYHKFDDSRGEIGKYVDFTSLYPWALKYGTFPVSHPIAYRGAKVLQCLLPNGEWSVQVPCNGEFRESGTRYCPENVAHFHHHLNFFGIAKLKVSAPSQLQHPVLPYRCDSGKLVFTLCAKCAENNNQESECTCLPEERDWICTLTSVELEIALDAGYEIKEMIEILHWPVRSTNIFADYVNAFLKIKQEASGFPEHVKSESDIQEYIETYERQEGIRLDRQNIKKSSALRSLAKLMLNSIYGKFGQRLNLRKTHMVDSVPQLCDLICATDKTVVDFHILSEDLMQVETLNNEHFDKTDAKTNVIVSVFTASWARIKLWCVMQQLGSRVLYTDTDSLVYIAEKNPKETDPKEPPLGDFLGELTDELCCKNVGCAVGNHPPGFHYMTEFVTGGPKNYAYKLNNGECECKIRGFTLDAATARSLNFETLKSQVIGFVKKRFSPEEALAPGESTEPIQITRKQITRDKRTFELYNREITKRYGIVLDKSRIKSDFTSVAFGTRGRKDPQTHNGFSWEEA